MESYKAEKSTCEAAMCPGTHIHIQARCGSQLKGLIQLPFGSPAPTGLDLTLPGLAPLELSRQGLYVCTSRATEGPSAGLRGSHGSVGRAYTQSTLRKGYGLR